MSAARRRCTGYGRGCTCRACAIGRRLIIQRRSRVTFRDDVRAFFAPKNSEPDVPADDLAGSLRRKIADDFGDDMASRVIITTA